MLEKHVQLLRPENDLKLSTVINEISTSLEEPVIEDDLS